MEKSKLKFVNRFGETILLSLYGVYCLYLYLSSKINFFVHPDYAFLALVSGVSLSAMALALVLKSFTKDSKCEDCFTHSHDNKDYKGWLLIILPLILALIFQPKPLSSAIAETRNTGLYADAGLSREVVAFSGFSIDTKKRSLVDWIRLFNQDPEPDHYKDLQAKLVGFVLKDQNLPENYFSIARFVISCCAADARPITIPVRYDASKYDEQILKNDQWIEIEGHFETDEIEGQRQPVLVMDQFKEVNIPENPYAT